MAAQNKGCAACLEVQQRIEAQAGNLPATVECFAGFTESAVPVRVGKRTVAFLQTGQVMLKRPTLTQFAGVLAGLRSRGLSIDEAALSEAYFSTQVLKKAKHDSVLQLLRIFAEHLSSVSNHLACAEANSQSPTIGKAREYITSHLGDEISLTDVARAAGMSVYYFCKVFKRELGQTFTEYLGRMRVETVKEMLVNPHKRISEAAYDAGFQSLSQFNRVFKHFTGETPSYFRDRLHGQGVSLGLRDRSVKAA
jgi:AraC-like DNA-binding protein